MRIPVSTARQPSPLARDGLAVALFVLLGFAPFAPDFLLGLMLLDPDIYKQTVPVLGWYGEAARRGDDFLWCPGILGGFPVAFSQYSLLSPLDWLLARQFPPDVAYLLGIVLYLPLAGIATYLYVRQLGISRLPALLAGVAYQLSTESLALGVNGYVARSLFLLPVLFLSVELVVARGSRWALLASGAVGLSLLTGQPFVCAIALLNAGAYTLVRAFGCWRKETAARALSLLGWMGAAVALGVGLAALRILPTLPVTAESVRSQGMSWFAASTGSPSVVHLVAGYLLPLTHLFWLGGVDAIPPSYVGPFVLALALLAVLKVGRGRHVALLAGLLAFDLLVSLGENGPIFGLLHQVPPFSHFRAPSRFSTASAFLLAVLAAQVLDGGMLLEKGRESLRRALKLSAWLSTVVVVLALLAGLLWVYGGERGAALRGFAEAHQLGSANPLRPRMALALMAIPTALWALHGWAAGRLSRTAVHLFSLAATACLLLAVGLLLTPRMKAPTMPPATASFLAGDTSLFRVISFRPNITMNHYLVYLAGGDASKVNEWGQAEMEFGYRYAAETMVPNLALKYGLESIDGYEVLQSLRQAAGISYVGSDYSEIHDLQHLDSAPGGGDLKTRLFAVRSRALPDQLSTLRAFNVKYVLTNLDFSGHPNDLRLAFSSQIPMLDPQSLTTVHVYEVLGALPRAYLVPESRTMNDLVEALDAVHSKRVDPTRTVILEREVQLPGGRRLDPIQSELRLTAYGNAETMLEARSDGSGFLVLNDAYHPGWRAWVDGKEVPIYAANGWVRAVPIEGPGTHSIRFAYVPPLLAEGKAISLLSLGLLGLLALLGPISSLRSMARRVNPIGG